MEWVKRIDALIKNGELKRALSELEKISKTESNNKMVLKKEAEIYYMQNNLESSLESYKFLISIYKPDEEQLEQFEILKNIGGIYGLLKNPEYTIEYYENALVRYNNLEEDIQNDFLEEKIFLLYDLATAYSKLKQYPKTLLIYERLIQIHSNYGPIVGIADDLFEIANIYLKQKEHNTALKNYYKSLEIYEELKHEGQQGIIHYYIGKILHLQDEFTEAFAHLDIALMIFTKVYLEMPFENIEENEYYRKAKQLWDDIRNNRTVRT